MFWRLATGVCAIEKVSTLCPLCDSNRTDNSIQRSQMMKPTKEFSIRSPGVISLCMVELYARPVVSDQSRAPRQCQGATALKSIWLSSVEVTR